MAARWAAAASLIGLSACTVQKPLTVDRVAASPPEQLHIVHQGAPAVVLDRPVVVGDSLVGQVAGQRRAYALSEVTYLYREAPDTNVWIAAGSGLVLGTVLIAAITAFLVDFALSVLAGG